MSGTEKLPKELPLKYELTVGCCGLPTCLSQHTTDQILYSKALAAKEAAEEPAEARWQIIKQHRAALEKDESDPVNKYIVMEYDELLKEIADA